MFINPNDKLSINIEMSNYCSSGCLLCPRHIKGTSETMDYVNKSSLDLNDFQEWFEDISFGQISMCGNYGDPIMCKDLIDIVKYIKCDRLSMDTNGGQRSTEWWTKLAKAIDGRHRITFWIDGLEDTLHIYRRGVEYNKVIENAKAFIKAGGHATWGFLKFAHNEHQEEEIKQLVKEYGFKSFGIKPVYGFEVNDGVIIDEDKVKANKR